MRLLDRHILRSVSGPFVFGLLVITFVLIVDILFRYVDMFVEHGVSFWTATEVLLLSLGHTLALSVPMSVLIGVLMGIGQLAADHEITAMKASGIGLVAVLRPLLLGSGLVALALTAYNHFVFPNTNHRLANLLYAINHKRPMLQIRPHLFTDLNDRLTIYVGEKDDRANTIRDVVVIERDGPGDPAPSITTAARGKVIPLHAQDALRIELYDGETHDLPDDADWSRYEVTEFQRHDLLIRNAERDMGSARRRRRGDREMDLRQLLDAAREQETQMARAMANARQTLRGPVDQQWRLLDPAQRRSALHLAGQPWPLPAERRAALLERTVQSLRQAASAAAFQEDVARSYRARINDYLVEFHKKLAIPVACMVFVLLGLPMAVTAGRTGRGVSVSLALAVYVVYYMFLVGGEKLSDRGVLDPAVAMWSADVFLTLVGIPVFLRTVRESSLFAWTLRPRRRSSPEAAR